jgi:hypothetical protein
VIQPGTFDGGNAPADTLGTLADFEPINFGGVNVFDAAIAEVNDGVGGADVRNQTPSDGYGSPTTSVGNPAPRMKVQKYGRTTGQTKGRVWAVNASINVGYDYGVALFTGQVVVRGGGFSAGGDSGSLIVDDNNNPVGLLFAGGDSTTIFSPLQPILTRFGVAIAD